MVRHGQSTNNVLISDLEEKVAAGTISSDEVQAQPDGSFKRHSNTLFE